MCSISPQTLKGPEPPEEEVPAPPLPVNCVRLQETALVKLAVHVPLQILVGLHHLNVLVYDV